MDINGEESVARLDDVLYIPKLYGNLLSVSRLVSHGYTVIFDSTGCTIKNNDGKIVALAKKENNLYHIIGTVQQNNKSAYLSKSIKNDITIWHQ